MILYIGTSTGVNLKYSLVSCVLLLVVQLLADNPVKLESHLTLQPRDSQPRWSAQLVAQTISSIGWRWRILSHGTGNRI